MMANRSARGAGRPRAASVSRDPRLDLHLAQLDLAFDRRSWHGPNLLGSLRGIDPAGAAWRPQPERHNVAEIVVHCAYWKYPHPGP